MIMNGMLKKWKAKDLAWKKRYKKYHNEVLHYELYSQKQFSLHNALVFLLYGIVSYFWNRHFVKADIWGSVLCFVICILSISDYIICRTFLKKHIKFSVIVANCYIFILGKMLLAIDLMWNDMNGGNVSWTLLICSLITTAMISIVPSHYFIAVISVVVLDMLECILAQQDVVAVLYKLLDGVIISIFCIGMNVIYSGYQYAEFERREELKLESSRDLLTQLYNRRYIERYYDLHSEPDKLCAIMVLDLDNFKMANDIYGHKKGDEVLCAVSDILRSNFRDGDCVARLGGDEFIVFLSGIMKKDVVVERAQSLLKSFPIVIEGKQRVEVSVSIGIAYKNQGEEMEYTKLCNKADEAMYMAKRLGKGKAVVSAERNMREIIIVA